MNRFSEKKNKEFDQGFLGEKNFEISFRNVKSPSLKLQFDMHHLGLNKQSSYVGQRNLKYFNSVITLKNEQSGRKVSAHISPYSQQNYEFIFQQPYKANEKWKSAFLAGVSKVCENEITKLHRKDYTLGGYIKSNNFHNNVQFNYDEEGNYGVECSMRLFNFSNKEQLSLTQASSSSSSSSIDGHNSEELLQKQINSESTEESTTEDNQKTIVAKTPSSFKYEFCVHLKTVKFDSLQTSIFADLLFKKYESVFSANFNGKSLKGVMCMFKYNSSLWLKLTSNQKTSESNSISKESNLNNQVGVELVYQHQFNKFIHLKNYINSNYTIATQLSYHPSDFATLIYSATVNIQKFKQDMEDYKVGYGLHFNF